MQSPRAEIFGPSATAKSTGNMKTHRTSHLDQVSPHKLQSCSAIALARVCHSATQRTPYRRRTGERKSVNHWGQRKLAVSEIEFLSMFSNNNDIVVYAGAAPGAKNDALSHLFSDLGWHLYDPSPFRCTPSNNLRLHNEYFTEEVRQSLLNVFRFAFEAHPSPGCSVVCRTPVAVHL